MELQLDCRRLLNTDSKPVRTTAVCPPYKVSIAYHHDAARIFVLISSTVYILRYSYHKASRWESDRESSSIASVTSITRCISPLLHANDNVWTTIFLGGIVGEIRGCIRSHAPWTIIFSISYRYACKCQWPIQEGYRKADLMCTFISKVSPL